MPMSVVNLENWLVEESVLELVAASVGGRKKLAENSTFHILDP